jgi:hypothetical protein
LPQSPIAVDARQQQTSAPTRAATPPVLATVVRSSHLSMRASTGAMDLDWGDVENVDMDTSVAIPSTDVSVSMSTPTAQEALDVLQIRDLWPRYFGELEGVAHMVRMAKCYMCLSKAVGLIAMEYTCGLTSSSRAATWCGVLRLVGWPEVGAIARCGLADELYHQLCTLVSRKPTNEAVLQCAAECMLDAMEAHPLQSLLSSFTCKALRAVHHRASTSFALCAQTLSGQHGLRVRNCLLVALCVARCGEATLQVVRSKILAKDKLLGSSSEITGNNKRELLSGMAVPCHPVWLQGSDVWLQPKWLVVGSMLKPEDVGELSSKKKDYRECAGCLTHAEVADTWGDIPVPPVPLASMILNDLGGHRLHMRRQGTGDSALRTICTSSVRSVAATLAFALVAGNGYNRSGAARAFGIPVECWPAMDGRLGNPHNGPWKSKGCIRRFNIGAEDVDMVAQVDSIWVSFHTVNVEGLKKISKPLWIELLRAFAQLNRVLWQHGLDHSRAG